MNAIKNIRLRLDLKQEQLADYLGITRSLLSLAETGRRKLPVKALIRLQDIINLMNEAPEHETELISPDEREEAIHELRSKIRQAKLDILNLKKKMGHHRHCHKHAQIYNHCSEKMQGIQCDTKAWWNKKHQECKKHLKKYSFADLQLMEHRLETKEAEIRIAKRRIARLQEEMGVGKKAA